jgi:signal transduction histidine kinase
MSQNRPTLLPKVVRLPGKNAKRIQFPAVAPGFAAADIDRMSESVLQSLIRLGLEPSQVHPLLAVFGAVTQGLRAPSCRKRLVALGEEMARRQVLLDEGIAALDPLLQLYCSSAGGHAESCPPATLAAVRLHSLLVRLLAAGYSRHWAADRKELVSTVEELNQEVYRASNYVARTYERERHKLSRDLHDKLGHNLVRLKTHLEDVAKELKEERRQEPPPELPKSLALVSDALRSVRGMVVDLGPPVLEEIGLIPVVRLYVRQFSSRTGIDVIVDACKIPDAIPLAGQVALYRVLQESLCNFSTKAKARNVRVSFRGEDGAMSMTVEDDGTALKMSAKRFRLCYAFCREHASVVGGTLDIHSPPASAGNRIQVKVPLKGPMSATPGGSSGGNENYCSGL